MIFPEPIFFYRDDNGQYDIHINSYIHPKLEEVRKCYECLKYYYENLTQSDIDDYEEERRKYEEENRKFREKMQEEPQKRNPVIGYIYLIRSSGKYKIGRAISLSRIKTYRTENPNSIKVIVIKKVKDYILAEKEILARFNNNVVKGKEWLKLNKYELSELLEMINAYESYE